MLDNDPKAKRQKLAPAVGAMPDSSKVAVTKHYGQSVLEDTHTHGATQAQTVPLQQTGDKGKDVAEDAAGGTDQASASASSSKKPQSELASTSSRTSNFDSDPTGDEEAAVTVPAHANASTIVVEPADANASAIVVEPADANASAIVVEPADANASAIVVEPADANASAIVVEPADANASVIVVEPADANASSLVVEASEASEQIASADEKKQSLTNVNPDVKARLQNRVPKPFRDQPDQSEWTSGIGLLKAMMLMQQPEVTGEREGEAADHLQVNEPPMGVGGTVHFPTFEAGFANEGGDRVLMPSLEMLQVGIDGFLH